MNDELLRNLGVSLAVGLIVGLERGWKTRERHGGTRAAGIRSFTLAGLLGGATAALAGSDQVVVLAAGFIALGALVVTGYVLGTRETHDLGLTTEIALLATFALGAIAVLVDPFAAAVGAVVMAVVLGFKAEVHRVVAALDRRELHATLQLLLIAIVFVPLLPDEDIGPAGAVNPRTIGVLVLLIAGLSYVGYFAVRVLGARLGLMLTAAFGGLTSSTAVTVAYARRSREDPIFVQLFGTGIALAAATMVPRLALEIAAVNPSLLAGLWPTFAVLVAVPLLQLAYVGWLGRRGTPAADVALSNPLELRAALVFGALLSVFFIAGAYVQARLGDAGLYATAAVAGLVDVDAISLTLAHGASRGLDAATAERGIVLAALVNTASKAALATVIGGTPMLRHASVTLVAALAAATFVAVLTL